MIWKRIFAKKFIIKLCFIRAYVRSFVTAKPHVMEPTRTLNLAIMISRIFIRFFLPFRLPDCSSWKPWKLADHAPPD